jgi:hypothetical protein
MKFNSEKLSSNKLNAFNFFVTGFSEPEYDLSVYYERVDTSRNFNGDGLLKMCNNSGLYGLENVLFGGI